MTITIPFEIPSQNVTEKGRNWRGRAAKTKARRWAWNVACRQEMARAGIHIATAPRFIHITAYRKRFCSDIANLIGGSKACVDGLVDAGLLLDDRDSKAGNTYAQALASAHPSKKPCTVIGIKDTP